MLPQIRISKSASGFDCLIFRAVPGLPQPTEVELTRPTVMPCRPLIWSRGNSKRGQREGLRLSVANGGIRKRRPIRKWTLDFVASPDLMRPRNFPALSRHPKTTSPFPL